MLHQISWQAYVAGIIILLILYYLYVLIVFFRAEIQAFYFRLTRKQPMLEYGGNGLIPIPTYAILGAAQPDDIGSKTEETIEFGPSENPDEVIAGEQEYNALISGTDSRLIGQFSEMISEVKTLIRVINESAESRENFEMLFRLIVQKYPELEGTSYQQQVTEFLMEEGTGLFPFDITYDELETYWKN